MAQDVPQQALAALDEAAVLKREGKLVEAERRLGDALVLAPAYGEAWWLNAWVQAGLQDNAAALLAYQKASRLLPAGDPRVAQAEAKAAALQAAGVALPTPARPQPAAPAPTVTPPYRSPPPPVGNPWAGWPAALLSLVLMICCGAAWSALRSDAKAGQAGPHARFASCCRRLAAGEDVPLPTALAVASDPNLAVLPEADRVALVAASAARSAAARTQLATLVTASTGLRRRLAALALAAQQEQPEPGLWTGLLEDQDVALRAAALRSLAAAPDPAAAPLLATLARQGEADQASLAVEALDRLGDDAALQLLATLAASAAGPAARAAALAALARRRRLPQPLATPLSQLLDATRGPQRVTVIKALAATGDPALPRLLDALLDAAPEVRAAVRDLLLDRRIKPELSKVLAQRLIDAPREATSEALEVIAAWSPGRSGAVLERVLQADEAAAAARLTAIAQLTLHESDGASNVLLRAFSRLPQGMHPSEPERELATALAAGLAHRGVVDALGPLLERAALHPDEPAWRTAARRLAALPSAGEALAAAVGQRAGKVRRQALALLAEFPHPAATDALLAELSRAGSPQAESGALLDAATALGAIGDARARQPLLTLLERHPELAGDQLDVALAQLGDPEAQSRVEAMLVRGAPEHRRPAAAYFRRLEPVPPRAAGVVAEAAAHVAAGRLLSAAEDPTQELARLGEAVEPTLQAWLLEPAKRGLAAAALAQLGHHRAPELARAMEAIDALPDDAPAADLRALLEAWPELQAYARERVGDLRWQALSEPESEPT